MIPSFQASRLVALILLNGNILNQPAFCFNFFFYVEKNYSVVTVKKRPNL